MGAGSHVREGWGGWEEGVRRGAGVVEQARLESAYGSQGSRGFESHSLRRSITARCDSQRGRKKYYLREFLGLDDELEHGLVIVEAPTKARTIGRILGRKFTVMASFGHVRDLYKVEIIQNSNPKNPKYYMSKPYKNLF